jgi:predicted methyltransferase
MPYIFLTHFQAEQFIKNIRANAKVLEISLDLGKTHEKVDFIYDKASKIFTIKTFSISLSDLKRVLRHNEDTFILSEEGLEKVKIFSNSTNKLAKLVPTSPTTAPVLEISGVRMHNVSHIDDDDPMENAKLMVESLGVKQEKILEIGFGLGYTSKFLMESGNHVTVYEIDPAVIEIAKISPWSQDIVQNPALHIINKDISIEIKSIPDASFEAVFHDPPRLKNAEELYAASFYKELYRVLKHQSKIYHYIGRQREEFQGVDIFEKVKRNLKTAGFGKIEETYLGLTAVK